MFLGVTPTILRPSLLSAILKPQDVFAILAQPANQMQAAIGALPFSPDLLIGKDRVTDGDWAYRDSLRGLNLTLASNTTAAEATWTGYSGTNNRIEYPFKRAPKFLDIVKWTGDGASTRKIPHALGAMPGLVVVKRLDVTSNWPVKVNGYDLALNLPDAYTSAATTSNGYISGAFTSADFTVLSNNGVENVNASGGRYVAYIFANDTGADGIVRCGSFTLPSGTTQTIELGWRPQFLIHKAVDVNQSWRILDTTRGWSSGSDQRLYPNLNNAEDPFDESDPTSTGFTIKVGLATGNYVYLAIRAPY